MAANPAMSPLSSRQPASAPARTPSHRPTTHDPYNGSKFWLEFAVFHDGLDPPSATANAATTSSSAPGFARFPDLPPELRLKIWGYLIQPRIVVVSCLERSGLLPVRRAELAARSQRSKIPVLLHVSRESRALALSAYELTFAWRISALLSETPVERPARVWFNYGLDALYLTGELEAVDAHGFNSPMVYFLRREDTRRVRHVACPFRELRYPEQESEQIFGCLSHVVDRFGAVERVLLTVGAGDEAALAAGPLLSTDNVIQKIWNGWVCGTTVTNSTLANKQILMVGEDDLVEFLASH